jgi:trehalose/maltose hydrolase-like predicted phosphorylase
MLSDFQELDLRRGVLTRRRRVSDSLGQVTGLTNRRFVHMGAAHLGSEEMTIIPENWSGLLRIRSELDGTVTNSGVPRYRGSPAVTWTLSGRLGADTMVQVVETSQSHIRIAEAARTRVFRDGAHLPGSDSVTEQPGWIGCEFSVTVAAGQSVVAEKTVAIATSRDRAVREVGIAAAVRMTGCCPCCACMSSTYCRRSAPTASASTSAYLRAACTVRPTGGTCSGTSCSCSRCST